MRRSKAFIALIAILSMAVCATGEAAGCFVLSTSAGDMLVDMTGKTITAKGQYEVISPLIERGGGMLYGAYKSLSSPEITIIDEGGSEVVSGVYESIYDMGDGVLYAVKLGLTGAVDMELKQILPCEYTQLVYNGQDGFLAISSDPYDERADGVYFVSMDGVETATGVKVFYGLGMFYEGLMTVVDASNNRMGYLDSHGGWAIPSQYEYAGEFVGGVAEAALAAGSGFIDKSGNWLVTPKYAQVSRSGAGGLILVQENTSEILILDPETYKVAQSFSGEDIFFSAYYDVDMAVVYLDDCTLLIGPGGQTIMECGLDAELDAWAEMNDRYILRQGDWGEKCVWLCDMTGKRVSDAYQSIWHLGNTSDTTLFACASFDIIDYVDVETAWHDRVAVDESYKIDVIDADAHEILSDLPYENLHYDECGLLIFTDAATTGAMDLSGNVICEFEM